jgi:single-stranded-DNA-specific exonuclease
MSELGQVLQEYASTKLSPDQLNPSLRIESVVRPEDISLRLYEEIEQLAPFGKDNPLPIFASRNVSIAGGPWVLKTQHLKLQVRCNGSRLDAIWWKHGKLADSMMGASQVDLAYTISKDRYLGEEKLLLTIQDLRLGGPI